MKKEIYTIENRNGVKIQFTNYGGIVSHIYIPDREGQLIDVALGFDDVEEYESDHPFFGALVGRYANRIANGQFTIHDQSYQLEINNGPNCLHSGSTGFYRKYWKVSPMEDQNGYELHYESPHMEGGFPGHLDVRVRYILSSENRWIIQYRAVTDRDTVFNPTNHTYFNLNGAGNGSIKSHEISITANAITAVNDDMIPTGTILSVKDTPFDLRSMTTIEPGLHSDHPLIKKANGYDHNYAIKANGGLQKIAEVLSKESGCCMTVYTDQPGVQFYCGNFLGGIRGKRGKIYNNHDGFCLETQHFPDSPNQADFPSTLLRAGQEYFSETIYEFGVI